LNRESIAAQCAARRSSLRRNNRAVNVGEPGEALMLRVAG